MGGHDHICVDAKMFIFYAVVKAVGDDLTGCLVNEDWQPFDDCECHVI
jgi:hypothetical protein